VMLVTMQVRVQREPGLLAAKERCPHLAFAAVCQCFNRDDDGAAASHAECNPSAFEFQRSVAEYLPAPTR